MLNFKLIGGLPEVAPTNGRGDIVLPASYFANDIILCGYGNKLLFLHKYIVLLWGKW